MDKVMFSKEKLLKYIELEAHIIFKKVFQKKIGTYDHPWGSFNPIMRLQLAIMC